MSGSDLSTAAVAVGDTFCVTAHPYLRWTVVDITPAQNPVAQGAVPNVKLRSSADPAVERVIAMPVLQNPARFQRILVPQD